MRSDEEAPILYEPPTLYEPPGWIERHDRLVFWGIAALAMLVRAIYLLQLRDSPLWDDLPVDLGYYRDWALRIAGGDLEGSEVFEQSPLYAYFLALVFKIFGPGLLAPRVIQIAIGSLTCALIYRIGRRAVGPPAGLAAGLMACVYGPFLFYDGMIMKEVLAVFFMAWMLAQLLESGGWQRGMLTTSGLALGLGALVRDNLIVVAGAVILWLMTDPWLRHDRRDGEPGPRASSRVKEGLGRAAAFAIGLAVAILPVSARNYHVGGEFVLLTAGGGEVFYIGNNPQADGRYSPPPFVRAASGVEHEDFRVEAARRLGVPRERLTRRDSSRYWMSQGLDWIRAHPGEWLRLVGLKLAIFFNHYELPDNQSYAHHRLLLPILRWPLLTFSVIAPLALGGAALALARWREALPLYVAGTAYIGSVMLFFNFGRFRMPALVVLLVLAGALVGGLAAAIRGPRRWRAVAALAVTAVAMPIVNRDLERDPAHLGQSHALAAELLARAGRLAEAETEAEEGIRYLEEFYSRHGGQLVKGGHGVPAEGKPGRPALGATFYGVLAEAYRTRAKVARGLGRLPEAEEWERHAASVDSGLYGEGEMADPVGLARRGRRQMQEKKYAEAAASFAAALAAAGPGIRADAALALTLQQAEALHRAGAPREALDLVAKAVVAANDLPPEALAASHFGRALIYRDLKEPEMMREHLAECLRLNPSHPRADWIREQLAITP